MRWAYCPPKSMTAMASWVMSVAYLTPGPGGLEYAPGWR